MHTPLRIKNARVIDPAGQGPSEVRDICIEGGRVVPTLSDPAQARTIDATGCVAMAGGVEIHAHVASMPVNAARVIQSVSGYPTVVPTPREAGRLYSLMGYTTVIEPAVPPGAALASHRQLDLLPNLEAGLLLLLGNHEPLLEDLARNDEAAALRTVAQRLEEAQALGIKAVNPVGVAAWRRDPARTRVGSLDDPLPGAQVTPRSLIGFLSKAADTLGLAHPLHLHGPQLGEPGNADITTQLIREMPGRLHLAHLQYYCYGKTRKDGFKSDASAIVEAVAANPRVTLDLGLVSFGPAFTATADLPLEHALYRHVGVPGKPALFHESGNEDCFGIMPLVHSPGVATHAFQWATGLELALLLPDPSRVSLTIDHPNGGSFLNYPLLIGLLMSRALREEQLNKAHAHARNRTGLGAITREYSLEEIVTVTRVAPARALGLKTKGHLGIGADGDVALYPDTPGDPVAMFTRARWTVQKGRVLVDDFELREELACERLSAPVQRPL